MCSDGALKTGTISESVSMTAGKNLSVYLNIHKQASRSHLLGNRLKSANAKLERMWERRKR